MGWNDHMDPEVADRILRENIPNYDSYKHYAPFPDTEPCEACDGEGQVEYVVGNGPYDAIADIEECDDCSGRGYNYVNPRRRTR